MNPQQDALQKITEKLADGQPVDWSAVEDQLDPELLDGLRQIEALAGGFGAVATEPIPPKVAPSLPAGSRFAHLVIQELIGRGAYGAVYRALDSQLDRCVALKVLGHPTLSRAELLREGQLMARIDHPNVLKVFGAIEHDGQIAFACELMRGETLEQWLGHQGRLGASELATIGGELCAALCALHGGEVLHGDLKPGNVLRHPNGRWVVADFGSSQFAYDAYGSSGTPLYMAPEQFRHLPTSQLTDQYSLGVLLFRLATKRYPFEAETTAELEAKHAADTRLRLLDLRPDLPPALIAVIERTLAIDPKRRYPSIGALAGALAQAAPPPAVPLRARRSWAIAIAATAVLAVLASLWWRPGTPTLVPAQALWLRASSAGDQVLRPGEAVRPGEALAMELMLDQQRFVYVINEDSHGERFQLFPLADSDLINPLAAGKTRLPGKSAGVEVDWQITSRGGREHFYVLLAEEPLTDLQQLALQPPTLEAGADAGLLAANGDPLRGVGGLTPRSNDAQTQDADWIDALLARHPGTRIERFELANP